MKWRRAACPSPVELERAFWSEDAGLRAHAEACPRCGPDWEEMQALVKAGREIAVPPSSRDAREELRATLLSLSEPPGGQPPRQPSPPAARPRPAWQLAFGPLAAAAAVAAIAWWMWPAQRAATVAGAPARSAHRGQVLAHGGARYLVASAQPDEIVRLVEGTLTVEVDGLGRGERFRIMTGDAELDLSGTALDVTAAGDRLVAVRVVHGAVELRAQGSPPRALSSGQTWSAPVQDPALPPGTAAAATAASPPGTAAAATAALPPGTAAAATASPPGMAAAAAAALPPGTAAAAKAASPPGIAATAASPPGTAAAATAALPPATAAAATALPSAPGSDGAAGRDGEVTRGQRTRRPTAVSGSADKIAAATATSGSLDSRAPEPAPPAALPPARDDAADAGPPPRSAAQQEFDDGWSAIRSGAFQTAAAAFGRAASRSDDPALREDALFWSAVALARDGQSPRAIRALWSFLDAYPSSARAGEASAILGWILYEAGDHGSAARLFRAAASDRSPRVRASAAAGLEALQNLRR